jgi:twitching motility two-component system response regulator PilH
MILIVDDEPSALVLLDMILKRDNYAVRKATTGREAIRLLEREDEQDCELIVTDIRMPEMDGRELVARLRSSPRTASIPVIMCTSTSDRATVIALVGQGVRDFIVKPVAATTLLQKVHTVLDGLDPVMEPRNKTIARLEITHAEYMPMARAAIDKFDELDAELTAALRGRNGRVVRSAAEKVREPASWFGGKRVLTAARAVISTTSDRDAVECGEALSSALVDLRNALRIASAPLS